MQVSKVTCSTCGQVVSKSNFTKHQRRHENHPESFKEPLYRLTHEGLECQFCGKVCKNRNSLCNHERLCKNNPNKQKFSDESDGFAKYNKDIQTGKRTVWNKGLTKETDARISQQSNALSRYYLNHSGSFTGKTHSQDTKNKIRAGVKKFLAEHPEMVPYKRNHASKESYPEKYFSDLFDNENVVLLKQFSVAGYFLDFCDPIKKVDIEIDGDQHYLDPKIVEHDKIRNKSLQDLGWTIYRVKWSDYKKMTIEQKQVVITKIKELLK